MFHQIQFQISGDAGLCKLTELLWAFPPLQTEGGKPSVYSEITCIQNNVFTSSRNYLHIIIYKLTAFILDGFVLILNIQMQSYSFPLKCSVWFFLTGEMEISVPSTVTSVEENTWKINIFSLFKALEWGFVSQSEVELQVKLSWFSIYASWRCLCLHSVNLKVWSR